MNDSEERQFASGLAITFVIGFIIGCVLGMGIITEAEIEAKPLIDSMVITVVECETSYRSVTTLTDSDGHSYRFSGEHILAVGTTYNITYSYGSNVPRIISYHFVTD